MPASREKYQDLSGRKRTSFSLKLAADDLRRLRRKAKAWGVSLSRYLVESGLRRRSPKKIDKPGE